MPRAPLIDGPFSLVTSRPKSAKVNSPTFVCFQKQPSSLVCYWISPDAQLPLSVHICICIHTHTRLFLWILETFHRLLLFLYWPNNIFYPNPKPTPYNKFRIYARESCVLYARQTRAYHMNGKVHFCVSIPQVFVFIWRTIYTHFHETGLTHTLAHIAYSFLNTQTPPAKAKLNLINLLKLQSYSFSEEWIIFWQTQYLLTFETLSQWTTTT